jgi:microcin C transport system permease protein
MTAYILRRALLMIPTLLGIMLFSFIIIQFAPGGPIEHIIAQLNGTNVDATSRIGGASTGDFSRMAQPGTGSDMNSRYRGARGLDPELIKSLEKEFGFDKPAHERFLMMMMNYSGAACHISEPPSSCVSWGTAWRLCADRWRGLSPSFCTELWAPTFNFGDSYFKKTSVLSLIGDRLPVSISLGLWLTILTYLISIPLGVQKAVKDGSRFDVWTSTAVIIGYAIPGFLFAIFLIVIFAGGSFFNLFPLRGLVSDNWHDMNWPRAILDYFWHLTLPVTAMVISSLATITFLTKNCFLDEIRKQYVMTARAKGLTETRVLYGHVFRNAMLLVISGFPAAFIGSFFTNALLIETIFSLDGLGRLSWESVVNRDYAVVFATLYIFSAMGLLLNLLSDLIYTWVDPRIDFESREV